MSEGLRSIVLGTSAISVLLAVAIVLAVSRPITNRDPAARDRLLRLFLLGVAVQCLHVIEEFVTGFHVCWPELLGLVPWSGEFFVAFNLTWIAIWVASAVALRGGWRPALVPIWLFTLGMSLNLVAHPLLSLLTGGYFPGLVTSPAVGVFGVMLWSRLLALTEPPTG